MQGSGLSAKGCGLALAAIAVGALAQTPAP